MAASSEGQQAAPSVSQGERGAQPRVIPSSQLVILRESELECDLSTAIQRVREDEGTCGSRILIVAADEDPRARIDPQSLPMPQLPMSIGQVARSGGQQALEASGQRLAPKLQSLDCLFDEIGRALDDADEVAREGTRATMHSKVRLAQEILGWIRANTVDVQQLVGGMVRGFQVVEVLDLLQEVHGQVESFFPQLRVNIAPADGSAACWGRATDLAEGLFLAIVLTAHRIGGKGSVNVQVSRTTETLAIRVLGLGEPCPTDVPREMTRCREIIVQQHRGRIVPDSMGPFGTGMVLELPTAP